MRVLRIAALIEAASLTTLLVNLITVHTRTITTIAGPVHGISYVIVIAAAALVPSAAASGARWRACIPAIGGLLALRRLSTHAPPLNR